MEGVSKKHLFTKNNYLLDLSHLKHLESSLEMGDRGRSMRILLLAYVEQTPLAIEQIQKALLKGDRKSIADLSYRLRINAKKVGATYVAELGLLLEKSLINHPKDLAEAKHLGDQLISAFYVTRDQIQAFIAAMSDTPP